LEQARRKLGAILWRDSVVFGENFSDGRILSAILLESRSKSSHLSRRVTTSKDALLCLHLDRYEEDKQPPVEYILGKLPSMTTEEDVLPCAVDIVLKSS
jgi:hypothetical protein